MKIVVIALALGIGACGQSPCKELSKLCETCNDADLKAACQLQADAVDADDDACQGDLDSGRFDQCR